MASAIASSLKNIRGWPSAVSSFHCLPTT